MLFTVAGCDSRGNAEINCWFLYSEAANDVGVDIVVANRQSNPFGKNREQHEEATVFNAVGGATSVPEVARCHQGLHFDQQGACAFHADDDGAACSADRSIGQENGGG